MTRELEESRKRWVELAITKEIIIEDQRAVIRNYTTHSRQLEDVIIWAINTLESKTAGEVWWAKEFATELRKRADMVTLKIEWQEK